MNWIERMNWPFLETDMAERVWDEARRLFFEEDYTLDNAFTKALTDTKGGSAISHEPNPSSPH